jgi:hypothetical protein
MVFAAGCYAIFDVEEIFILLGIVPATCLMRRALTLSGLPSP